MVCRVAFVLPEFVVAIFSCWSFAKTITEHCVQYLCRAEKEEVVGHFVSEALTSLWQAIVDQVC